MFIQRDVHFLIYFRTSNQLERMKSLKEKPLLIFIILFLAISIPLCTLPIELFPGEVTYGNGIHEITEDFPLSLSYFLGLGYNESDMDVVKDFHLKPTGYALAFIVTIGLPALVAIRFYGKKKS